MALIDTLDYFIQDQEAHLQCCEWDIREETNQENPDIDWYCQEYDLCLERINDLRKIRSELERLQRYDYELSSVMPKDYKDWWQNSKEEWPEVAKCSIESLREREEQAWQQVEFAYEEMERNK